MRDKMFRHRIYNYWNCSKFADFVRGTPKPLVLTDAGWKQWQTTTQKNSPIRYYLAETFLKNFQKVIMFPINLVDNILYYLHNRFILKTHYLESDLKSGEWYDYDTRILHASFNELVKYVQIDCAKIYLKFNKNGYKPSNGLVNYFRPWRSEKAGLEYLDMLTDMGYNDSTKKIKQLYMWWIYTRPARSSDSKSDMIEFQQEDTQKLVELIKLRTFMWT